MTKTILSVCRGNLDAVSNQIWGCSSAGRAPALQAGGQEFDSPHLHQYLLGDTEKILSISCTLKTKQCKTNDDREKEDRYVVSNPDNEEREIE